MKPRTIELRRKLKEADWFGNCGSLRAEDATDVVKPVKSLKEALKVWFDTDSRDARAETYGELLVAVAERYGTSLWDAQYIELRRRIHKLVEDKLATPGLSQRIGRDELPDVMTVLKTDLLELCLACEFQEVLSTKFYEALETWYLAGHFPCGWVDSRRKLGGVRIGKLAVC